MDDVIEAEGVTRVLRTFAFLDVSGFTAFTDREGDAAAVVLLDSIRGIIRRLASVHGVRIAKWLGDGAMLVGVEPEPVMEALVSIVEENRAITSMTLRAGVATGGVILFEGDDHIGQAVNLASRLCDLAGPNEILAPADMMTPLSVNTRAVPVDNSSIPGFASSVSLVRLEGNE